MLTVFWVSTVGKVTSLYLIHFVIRHKKSQLWLHLMISFFYYYKSCPLICSLYHPSRAVFSRHQVQEDFSTLLNDDAVQQWYEFTWTYGDSLKGSVKCGLLLEYQTTFLNISAFYFLSWFSLLHLFPTCGKSLKLCNPIIPACMRCVDSPTVGHQSQGVVWWLGGLLIVEKKEKGRVLRE